MLLPVAAQDAPDCSVWTVEDLPLGITVEQAQASGRTFAEFKKYRDPLGYARYIWQAPDRPRKIELHVDVSGHPPRVIGVMTTVPTSEMAPREFLEKTIARWGDPLRRVGKGAFTLYTWANEECDVSVRLSVMNQPHDVGAWVALNSNSGRDEFARRKREAGEKSSEKTPPQTADTKSPAAAEGEGGD